MHTDLKMVLRHIADAVRRGLAWPGRSQEVVFIIMVVLLLIMVVRLLKFAFLKI